MVDFFNEKECIILPELDDFDIKHPYIIRNISGFNKYDANYVLKCFSKESEPIFSHKETSHNVYFSGNMPAKDLYKQWLDGTTQYNVVDSANSHFELISDKLRKFYKQIPEDMECAISYVLTNKGALTKFHIDPYDGWMYLYAGDKLWWFISPKDIDYLSEKGFQIETIMAMNWAELISICDGYLKGKIWVGRAKSGDFIYIPFGWAHRVYSYEKCVGISGTTDESIIHSSFRNHPDYAEYFFD